MLLRPTFWPLGNGWDINAEKHTAKKGNKMGKLYYLVESRAGCFGASSTIKMMGETTDNKANIKLPKRKPNVIYWVGWQWNDASGRNEIARLVARK